MTARKRRMFLVAFIVLGSAIAVTFAIEAFKENMLYFYSPSEIKAGTAPVDHTVRLGGLVLNDSVKRDSKSLKITFTVTDLAHTIDVQYEGILPDLFREGQGIIAIGKLNSDGVFLAQQVLAKHDENYMPPEVKNALDKAQKSNQPLKPIQENTINKETP